MTKFKLQMNCMYKNERLLITNKCMHKNKNIYVEYAPLYLTAVINKTTPNLLGSNFFLTFILNTHEYIIYTLLKATIIYLLEFFTLPVWYKAL